MTKVVYRDEVGGTLGLSASVQTLAQIMAPGLDGLLLDLLGTWSVGLVAGLIMVWTLSVARRRVVRIKESDMVSCRQAPAAIR